MRFRQLGVVARLTCDVFPPNQTHPHNPTKPTQNAIIQPTGDIKDARCKFETVDDVNHRLSNDLDELVKTKFFRYHKINLHRTCPFWTENAHCLQEGCSVQEVDENEIPEEWKNLAISAVDFSQTSNSGFSLFKKSCEFTDKDFCVIEDEASADGAYVDLLANPERFTGYNGPSAARIWEAIYRENCFSWLDVDTGQEARGSPLGTDMVQGVLDNTCMEKRVFYKLLSGLHASISTHICHKMLDRKTGVWYSDLDCYINRVGKFPDRVENVYFTYGVLLRALTKLSPFLQNYNFCTGEPSETEKVKSLVENIVSTAGSSPSTFDEKSMFATSSSKALKEEFKSHFRNISRIMDCVTCEKCRLWGKIQISGLGTALKILFSYGDNISDYRLTRSELVALVNGFARISESLRARQYFQMMLEERLQQEREAGQRDVEEVEKMHDQSALIAPKAESQTPSSLVPPGVASLENDTTLPGDVSSGRDTFVVDPWRLWTVVGIIAVMFMTRVLARTWHRLQKLKEQETRVYPRKDSAISVPDGCRIHLRRSLPSSKN
ncbi:hypothetical protein HK102_005537 [Quaeritorhiza haematococci]|nr:hypothetical protein HK102_005537 [Quaeritorhiza haematococci]